MIGFGYDIHRLAVGETLILGGVNIASDFGTVAHSDGDVLVHALMDAILGAAGLPDIGELFPDTDSAYKNADSCNLLRKVCELVADRKLKFVNIDMTLVLEAPKIKPYKSEMKENLAAICGLPVDLVGLKATTNEAIGAIGRGEGIAAMAVVQLEKI